MCIRDRVYTIKSLSIVLNMPFMPKNHASRVGMCESSQLTRFYKINRNWELLSPSAGKKENIWNIIVSPTTTWPETAGVTVCSERMSVMA